MRSEKAAATRSLGGQRRLNATLWCDGGRGSNLRFSLDVVEPIDGVERARQVPLDVPWPDPGHAKPAGLDLSARELLPEQSPERLAVAITFLAAVERAKGLWDSRHVRGEVEDRVVPAAVVFVGANLVTVEADGARLTFRLDTKDLDRSRPLFVARWYRSPAGSLGALRLISDGRAWDFDARGQLAGRGAAPA